MMSPIRTLQLLYERATLDDSWMKSAHFARNGAVMAQGKANTTSWFQKTKAETDRPMRQILQAQVKRLDRGRAEAGGDGAPQSLRRQIGTARKLLHAGQDYYSGKRGYFPRGRNGAAIPRSEAQFVAIIQATIDGIEPMFERADIT